MRLASNSTIKKSVTTKPTTPHFRAPRMVSTISVSTVTAASLDSRERVRDLLPNASWCKKRIVIRAGLYMYHYSRHLQAGDKKLFDPKCSIVKYKKFVSLSDPRTAEGKTIY